MQKMAEEISAKELAKQIKGTFGQWLLVQLASEKWSPVWHAAFGIDDLFLAILLEDEEWFSKQRTFAPPSVCATKTEALREIISGIERGMKLNPTMSSYFELELKRAKMALVRAIRQDKS